MFKELYNHVLTRIETLQDAQSPPQAVIRWIDFDLGQLDQTTQPVSFPCALITFGDSADYTTMQDGSQQSSMTITIRLGFKMLDRTNSKANPTFRDESLSMLNTVEAVHNTLQNSNGENFGNFDRTAMRNDRKADIRVFELDYKVVVFYASPDFKANNGPFIQWNELSGSPALPNACIHEHVA